MYIAIPYTHSFFEEKNVSWNNTLTMCVAFGYFLLFFSPTSLLFIFFVFQVFKIKYTCTSMNIADFLQQWGSIILRYLSREEWMYSKNEVEKNCININKIQKHIKIQFSYRMTPLHKISKHTEQSYIFWDANILNKNLK